MCICVGIFGLIGMSSRWCLYFQSFHSTTEEEMAPLGGFSGYMVAFGSRFKTQRHQMCFQQAAFMVNLNYLMENWKERGGDDVV